MGFLSAQVTAVPVATRLARYAPCPGHGAPCAYPSLFQLMPLARLAVLVLLALLFVALMILSRLTAGASWLTGDARARLLWVLLVMAGGLIGWSYAAVVSYAAGFGSATQLILAYTVGGLPFALAAALLRPWRVNVVAGGVCAGLVAAGFLMVAGRPAPQNVFLLYADYARSFFSGGSVGGSRRAPSVSQPPALCCGRMPSRIRASIRSACPGSGVLSVAMLTACTSLIRSLGSTSVRTTPARWARASRDSAAPLISLAHEDSSSESVPKVASSAVVMLRLVLLNFARARIQSASASAGDSAPSSSFARALSDST